MTPLKEGDIQLFLEVQVSKISEFLAYMNAVLLRRNIWL